MDAIFLDDMAPCCDISDTESQFIHCISQGHTERTSPSHHTKKDREPSCMILQCKIITLSVLRRTLSAL